MLKEQRHKYSDEQIRELLKGYLNTIEKAVELEKSGDKVEADRIFADMKADVQAQIDEIESESKKQDDNIHEQFSREILPDKGGILGEKNGIRLIAFDESYKELYLKTEEENSVLRNMFGKDSFRDLMWEECKKKTALHYAIIDVSNDKYVGYVAIKDIRKHTWEIAIVLLPDFRYKGYGKAALTILFDELHNRTGRGIFRSRVDSDNYASQTLMRKMGARANGISEFLLHGEDVVKFQKEHLALIDDKLIEVANEFCVAAEDLLGHVLEYLIDWPQK